MSIKPRLVRFALVSILLLLVLAVGSVGALTYWGNADPEKTCLSCHEIADAYDRWTDSAHRYVECKECHGTALSGGIHGLQEKARMVLGHVAGRTTPLRGISERNRLDMMDRCKACHEKEYADWTASGHSLHYADVFRNEAHNRSEKIADRCLQCHGMFYEGTVDDLVEPHDIDGPWEMLDAAAAGQSAIPCFACHQFHAPGTVAVRPDYANPGNIAAEREPRSARVGFYYRYEDLFFPSEILPNLVLNDGDRVVRVSEDPRQRVCIQCHAPNNLNEAGSSDDRTPRGVHEGLSCLACHDMHSNDARASCATCHPALSNCGIDVATMDTTFRDPDSAQDIHFVACADCHDAAFLGLHRPVAP